MTQILIGALKGQKGQEIDSHTHQLYHRKLAINWTNRNEMAHKWVKWLIGETRHKYDKPDTPGSEG
jgi:hypothetical protein